MTPGPMLSQGPFDTKNDHYRKTRTFVVGDTASKLHGITWNAIKIFGVHREVQRCPPTTHAYVIGLRLHYPCSLCCVSYIFMCFEDYSNEYN